MLKIEMCTKYLFLKLYDQYMIFKNVLGVKTVNCMPVNPCLLGALQFQTFSGYDAAQTVNDNLRNAAL